MVRFLLALTLTPGAALAQTAQPAPKLVVAISVDQLSADLFAQYRAHFTGGFKRMSEGVVFPNGYQSHSATETCPGHSTILTGVRPARNGIIANSWIDLGAARTDKTVYCAEDERVAGSTSKAYMVSAYHLKVPTLGERMKAADPRVRVVAVAGKDRSAVMMGGHRVDQLWYWSGKSFEGSAIGTPARAVTRANAETAARIARGDKPLPLSPLCALRSQPMVAGTVAIGTGRFERAAGDARAFRYTPALDEATIALAGDIAEEARLGRGPQTDVLIVGAAGTDYIGHGFGNSGSEMCLQLQALDTALATLFARLDKAKIDYVAMLTSDHGGADASVRDNDRGLPGAETIDPALTPTKLGEAVAAELGLPAPLLYGTDPAGDVYIDRAVTGPARDKVIARAKARYLAHPQVAGVFSAADIAATPAPDLPPENWTLAQRARASYAPGRSGDLIVLLKPYVTPIASPGPGYVATHGSAWDYDRRVPVLFWRRGLRGFEQPASVETVDIAPTLAAIVGFPLPAGEIDGVCRDLDAGAATTCR